MPPSAGPAIAPVCQAVELSAIALRQDLARHEVGRQRAERRAGKGAGDAEQGGDAEQDRQADEPAQVADEQDQRAEAVRAAIDGARDVAAVEPVGGPAADRRQHEQRHELDEADQPELERGLADVHRLAGDVVDLPADDDDHRHLRDRRGQPREPVGAEAGSAAARGGGSPRRRLQPRCACRGNRRPAKARIAEPSSAEHNDPARTPSLTPS